MYEPYAKYAISEVVADFDTNQKSELLDSMSTKPMHSNSPSEITSIDVEQNLEVTQVGNVEEASAAVTPRAHAPTAPPTFTHVEQANNSNTRPLSSLDSSTMDQIALSTLYSVEATLVPDTTSVQINDEPIQPSALQFTMQF